MHSPDYLRAKNKFQTTLSRIRPADPATLRAARDRQNKLAKVPGSLGRLEEIAVKIAGITGKTAGNPMRKQAIAIFCADNGVVREGTASAPQSVTTSQMINFTRGMTGVSSQAAYFGIDILDIDLGAAEPAPPTMYTHTMTVDKSSGDASPALTKKVVDRRISAGTGDILQEPAMTLEQVYFALETGIEAAEAFKTCGVTLSGAGEMGIGNTTTSSTLLTLISGEPAAVTAGRGGGLDDAGLRRKIDVVDRAAARVREAAARKPADLPEPVFQLAEAGGFDIAALAGFYLACAALRMPAVVDGFICQAAACAAKELAPAVTDYLFIAHRSAEPGSRLAAEYLGLAPLLDLGMRLGEGSGCPVAFKLIEAACAANDRMRSLDEGGIDSDYLDDLTDSDFGGGRS